MKQNSNLNHFQQLLFHTFPTHFNIIFFGLTKTGAKTAPRVPKLGYFVGRVPKVSSRVILVTSGAGVVCHISISNSKTRDLTLKTSRVFVNFRLFQIQGSAFQQCENAANGSQSRIMGILGRRKSIG